MWRRLCNHNFPKELKKFDAIDSVDDSALTWKMMYGRLSRNSLQDYLLKVSILAPLKIDSEDKQEYEQMNFSTEKWMCNESKHFLEMIVYGKRMKDLDYFQITETDMICTLCNNIVYFNHQSDQLEKAQDHLENCYTIRFMDHGRTKNILKYHDQNIFNVGIFYLPDIRQWRSSGWVWFAFEMHDKDQFNCICKNIPIIIEFCNVATLIALIGIYDSSSPQSISDEQCNEFSKKHQISFYKISVNKDPHLFQQLLVDSFSSFFKKPLKPYQPKKSQKKDCSLF